MALQERPKRASALCGLAGAVALLLLSACANYQAVSRFAADTRQLTGTTRGEFDQLVALCRQQADLAIVVLDLPEDGAASPQAGCEDYAASQGLLADATLATLDLYAQALERLADDRSLDLRGDIAATGDKLAALKARGGQALLDGAELGALTQVLGVLANVATQARREQAIHRLVDVMPEVITQVRLLRRFFAPSIDRAGTGASARSPYDELVGLSAARLDSYARVLRSPAMRQAEPLRARELTLAIKPVRAQIAARSPAPGPAGQPVPGAVPQALLSAIDAWLQAAETFRADALRPDTAQLKQRLGELRDALDQTRLALAARKG